MTETLSSPIYKIVTVDQWKDAQEAGVFRGAPVDLADGYIHFSAAHQVRETAARHFARQQGLLLVAVDPGTLGGALHWEISRGGDRFPHLYGILDIAGALWARPLPLTTDGVHDFEGLVP